MTGGHRGGLELFMLQRPESLVYLVRATDSSRSGPRKVARLPLSLRFFAGAVEPQVRKF